MNLKYSIMITIEKLECFVNMTLDTIRIYIYIFKVNGGTYDHIVMPGKSYVLWFSCTSINKGLPNREFSTTKRSPRALTIT